MSGKVFCVGLHKTGTSTLSAMLKTLRYRVCPGTVGYRLMDAWAEDNFSPILSVASKYNAFEDTPWCHPEMYKILDTAFPLSKFILTYRESNVWFDSTYRNYKRLCLSSGEFNFKRYGIYDGRKYYEKLYGFIPAHFSDLLEHREKMIEIYEKHNRDVTQYFAENQILTVNWETGSNWKDVCVFLDRPVIDAPLPWKRPGQKDGRA